ncbi:MAG: RNA 2',3'-cyclic phosphodiesterase [Gemmataceae bacterium]
MASLRTFIAIELETGLRTRLKALQETLSRSGEEVRWLDEEHFHFTLLFLGEVDERDISEVCRLVSHACAGHRPFPLSLQGVGCFPNLHRPRTIWAGIGEGSEKVIALHDAIEAPLVAGGFHRREERRFKPHLTLGRIKTDRPLERLPKAIEQQSQWQGGECTIDQVKVMSSQLTPRGPIYSVLSTVHLR